MRWRAIVHEGFVWQYAVIKRVGCARKVYYVAESYVNVNKGLIDTKMGRERESFSKLREVKEPSDSIFGLAFLSWKSGWKRLCTWLFWTRIHGGRSDCECSFWRISWVLSLRVLQWARKGLKQQIFSMIQPNKSVRYLALLFHVVN